MHRKALISSLSGLTLAVAGVGACGTATPTGGGFSPAGAAGAAASGATGAAVSGAGGASAGSAGASTGSGGAVTAGTAGVTSGGTGGTSNAGTGGVAGSGAGGTGGASVAGAAGASSNAGASGLIPPTKDPRGIYGHPDPATTYPSFEGAGFGKLPYLAEEFNAPIDLNRDPFWTWGDGALFDGQTHMVEKNISFSNGHMVLALTNEPVAGGYSFSAADNVADKPISAAEFRSIYNEFRYGRYEVSMKSGAGTGPSGNLNFLHTMFAYRAPAYLLWREIDIELTASPNYNFISNIIVAPAGTRVWKETIENSTRTYPYEGSGGPLPTGFDTQAKFHTYAFEWLPTSVKWYVDNVLVREKLDGQGKNNLAVPKESTKIIMNMWVFGNANLGGGDPKNNLTAFPIHGEYDYFRYYRWDQEKTYPFDANGARTAPNTPADLQWAKNNPKDSLPDTRPPMCTGVTGKLDTACGP